MRSRKLVLLVLLAVVVFGAAYGVLLIRRGFSATDEPSSLEKAVARIARNVAIPSGAPWKKSLEGHAGDFAGSERTLHRALRHLSCQ
jgi:hypothetical protein